MKKYDFSDKKLKRENLRSAIWLTVVCISPILYAVFEYHSNTVLVTSVTVTALAVFVVSYLWAFFCVFDFSDLRQDAECANSDRSPKKQKKPSPAVMLFLSLLGIAPIAAILIVRHFEGFLVKYMAMTAIVTAIMAFAWAFYFVMKGWDTDADFNDA